MTENIDPELVDDRSTQDTAEVEELDLPEYDPTQFELPDDFEYPGEVGEDYASEE